MAQIHALLYVSPRPLNAEDIAEALGVARSNVSTSLKELQGWGIVRIVHVMGDRRDHFESLKDVWEMFRIVLDERKKREIDPTVKLLDACVEQAQQGGKAEEVTCERLAAMREFFATMSAWYDKVEQLPTSGILKFVRAGEQLRKLFGMRKD